MQVLVTGGAGYLGCHLVPMLLERGHTVRVFDRFCFGDDILNGLIDSAACEVIHGDIRQIDRYPTLLDGVEGIVHLAGLANDPSCDLDPDMALEVNLHGSEKLAKLALSRGVRRFVFASSCSVYGQGVFELLDEQSPTSPVSVYGVSKLRTEQAVLPLKSATFEPVAARPATLFGWSQRMRFDLAVNLMTATACRKNQITVLGGGKQWRPFVHVHDAARAFIMMLEAPAETVSGEIFNVGSDKANYRILDLAEKVVSRFDGVKLEVAASDDDVRSYNVQFGKIREVLGFEPERSVDTGVDEIRTALIESSVDPFDDIFFNVRRMKRLLNTLATEGGEPISPYFIPLARPTLGDEELHAVEETIRSGWMTTGAKVKQFEDAFSQVVDAQHAVAVSSCTAAIHLCLVRAGVGPNDEVITPPLTWASTANTIVNMGAKPVFVDVRPDTLNIDPERLEAAITARTKAIIPVHLAGQPCDLDAIYAIAARHGIAVIEDAAHALDASYRGRPVGSNSRFACFSFYPIKNITTIEGGVITTDNEEDARQLRILASNGMLETAWDRYSPTAIPGPAEVVVPGFKYRMHDVSAVMGIEQLKKLPQFMSARRRLARMYETVLSEIDEISLPSCIDNIEHAWHLMIVRLDLTKLRRTRDEIAFILRNENIGTGIHFYGLHLHEYFREALGVSPQELPEATRASREILSLPLHPTLTDKHLQHVIEALKKAIEHSRK